MADLQPFANISNLTDFWKAPDNTTRATFLLNLASNRLRLIAQRYGVDIDGQVSSNPAYASTAQWVVMEAVKRALLTPTDAPPATSVQQTAGPYSENIVFSNPSGDLWFKKSELSDLGLYGNQELGSISTSRTDIYSPYDSTLGLYS